ncbi:helix-turn-helix domain-containing protein [Emticicia agri]|uniref:DNA-binding protein n=1 Tax=Emticicia agri TaxID=2492393 RepID=A0A4Q5LT39_9BACT|nr:helix-turn-helix domain-containing protein [Emticicia agri]RYU92714.1 DNA-binding protein [Emticicia agri]
MSKTFMEIIITTSIELSRIVQNAIRTVLTEHSSKNSESSTINEFLSINEAANFLKIPKASLYQLTSKREISFMKRSRRIFFKKSDLELWLEGGRKKTRSEMEQEALSELSKPKRK